LNTKKQTELICTPNRIAIWKRKNKTSLPQTPMVRFSPSNPALHLPRTHAHKHARTHALTHSYLESLYILFSCKNDPLPRNLFMVRPVRNLYMFSIALVVCTESLTIVAAMYSAVGSNIKKLLLHFRIMMIYHHLRKDVSSKFKNSPFLYFFKLTL